MKEKKGASLYTRLVSLLLCLAIAATLVPHVRFTLGAESGAGEGVQSDEKDGVYYISNFSDFMGAVGRSRTDGGNTLKYVLENDIEFTPDNVAAMQGWKIDHLTFGDEDHYFLGEFDGQGHTISGLDYANRIFKVATRTGLFSYVGHKDAAEALNYNTYIHDLTIEGANLHADYLSGIVAGEAYNTRFVNVNVVNSALSVNPADNALLLITDGGVIGGAIAGYAKHCTFYNCGTRNTTIRTNSVSGVAALAGKPLYLGGLVGQADTFTEIEYCRVMGGAVKNRYESSVGALGGFTCYAGGIAGDLSGGTKVIDCFASCDVSFYAATYVGVGAGCAGHAGGLVGKTDNDGNGGNGGVIIRRCHYAGGTISSYQYNTLLLMIPVQIANDVNRSGLVDKCASTTVEDSFFNYTDGIGPKNGKPANVLGDKKVSDEYGPQPDERYMDRTFWENRGYDFAGNIDRSTGSNTLGPHLTPQPYYNKWVMYYYDDPVLDADGNPVVENGVKKTVRRGYPVHGLSVAATFDFPGAGEVTLAPTLTLEKESLSDTAVTTTDPYRFAVLGIYPTECKPVTYTDGTPTKGGVNLSITTNDGYRLVNWYLLENVAAAGLPSGQHGYFDWIFANGTLQKDLNTSNSHVEVKDNQLYTAKIEALVEFHDLNGATLNKGTGEADGTPDLTDDWYLYGTPLPTVTPVAAPSDPNAKLIGWTTKRDTTSGDATPGWEQINATQLDELQKAGEFYETGDAIVSTLQLYPVYANRLLNVHVQIEGYDDPPLSEDGTALPTDKTYRKKVGQTFVTHAGDTITLRVKSHAVLPEGTTEETADRFTLDFPAGYRFLGWYELVGEGESMTAHCVSRQRDYTLPNTVDLNAEHTYEARFEYQVDYWVNYVEQDNQDGWYADPTLYATRWELYNAPFTVLKPPDFYRNHFNFWSLTGPQDKDGHTTTTAAAYEDPILDPVKVYSNYSKVDTTPIATTLTVTSDFPHSAVLDVNDHYGGEDDLEVSIAPFNHYHYIFSTLESWLGSGGAPDARCEDAVWDETAGAYKSTYSNAYTTRPYVYTAHLDADVIFHEIAPQTGGEAHTYSVTRRYQEPVFLSAPFFYDYPYTFQTGADTNRDHKSEMSPADPYYHGYHFVGWVDVDDPDTKSALDWIYDVSGYQQNLIPDGSGRCLTSDAERAKPYILTADDVVTRAMPNLYPVYAMYDVKTTTNVLMEVPGVVQKPADPGWALANDTAEQTTATITAYNNVAVDPRKPDGEKYNIESVTVTIDGGEAVTIATADTGHTVDETGNWVITYEVVPGKSYLFTAIYRPLVVVFHQNGNEETEVLVRNYGEPVGRPAPKEEGGVSQPVLPTVQDIDNTLSHALFVGWTEQRPGNGLYHFFPADSTPVGTPGRKTSYEKAKEFGFWTLGETEDTVVTHSMELWPVYATYTVDVNSNIDQDLMTNKGYTEATLWRDVRSLERESANTVSTTVKAAEVDGYKFVGWYTGVELDPATGEYSNFDNATAISEAESYTLEGGEPFTDKLYTARYKKVYKVIYHGRGKDGGLVMYTDYLYEGEDEDKSLNMKIKDFVDIPRVDEDGNFIKDENGEIVYDKVEKEYHQPLNPVPYHMIYATMDNHESFGQWECHDPTVPVGTNSELVNVYPYSFDKLLPHQDESGNTVPGLMSKVGTSDREINLYPTVWTVTVTDSTGKDITGDVKVDIDMSGMDPNSTEYKNVKVYVCFDPAKPYTQDTLTVRVQRTRWVETGDPNKPNIANRGRDGVEVIPYLDATKTTQMAEGQMTHQIETKIRGNDPATPESETDDGHGYAVFRFGSSQLRIVKNAPAEAKGETFLFQVTDTADTTQTWRVAVKCDTDVSTTGEDGTTQTVTGCTGDVVLSLPVGVYSVTEVDGWAWRQQPVLYQVYLNEELQESATNDAQKVVLTPRYIPPAPQPGTEGAGTGTEDLPPEVARVVCTNSRIEGNDWLVKTVEKNNLFGFPSAVSGG